MKGSRLPETWELPEDWRNWAIAQRPDLVTKIDDIAAYFKDFWLSKTGQNATKLDWFRTWCNWIRRQKNYSQPESKPMSHQKYTAKPVNKQQWQRSKEIARKHMEEVKRALK